MKNLIRLVNLIPLGLGEVARLKRPDDTYYYPTELRIDAESKEEIIAEIEKRIEKIVITQVVGSNKYVHVNDFDHSTIYVTYRAPNNTSLIDVINNLDGIQIDDSEKMLYFIHVSISCVTGEVIGKTRNVINHTNDAQEFNERIDTIGNRDVKGSPGMPGLARESVSPTEPALTFRDDVLRKVQYRPILIEKQFELASSANVAPQDSPELVFFSATTANEIMESVFEQIEQIARDNYVQHVGVDRSEIVVLYKTHDVNLSLAESIVKTEQGFELSVAVCWNGSVFDFSEALSKIKDGYKMARRSWTNGEFVFLVPGSTFNVSRALLLGIYPEGTEINYHAHIDIRSSNGQIMPWHKSDDDLLATDWMCV